nr:MAG TPA: nucleoside triphosphate pyrophosphohydrolase [Caudoviricetes sp.]
MTDIEKAELKAKLQMIYEHYGKYQFTKCLEELQELIEAINLYIVSGCSEEPEGHVVEEIADVWIMITQIIMMLNAENEVDEYKKYKVERQLERMALE